MILLPTFEVVRAESGRVLKVLMNGKELDGVEGIVVADEIEPPTRVTVRFISMSVVQRIEEKDS